MKYSRGICVSNNPSLDSSQTTLEDTKTHRQESSHYYKCFLESALVAFPTAYSGQLFTNNYRPIIPLYSSIVGFMHCLTNKSLFEWLDNTNYLSNSSKQIAKISGAMLTMSVRYSMIATLAETQIPNNILHIKYIGLEIKEWIRGIGNGLGYALFPEANILSIEITDSFIDIVAGNYLDSLKKQIITGGVMDLTYNHIFLPALNEDKIEYNFFLRIIMSLDKRIFSLFGIYNEEYQDISSMPLKTATSSTDIQNCSISNEWCFLKPAALYNDLLN